MEATISLVAGYATVGQGAGPMIVTERAGIFAKHGLAVETQLLGSAGKVVRSLMQGDIQFGNLAAPALLRAGLREGADIVYLTGGINQQFLLGRPGITNRTQLSGGKIGVAGDGGLNDILALFIREQLAREGIGNIEMVSGAVTAQARTERLVRGDIDAEIISPPEALEAKRRGCSFLIDFAEYGFNYALGGIAARSSYIRDHQDITKKFIRAYLEGMHRYRTDREFTVQVQQAYSNIQDRQIAEATYDITSPGMPQAPYPSIDALGRLLQVMATEIPQASTTDPRTFVDDTVVRTLDEEGFISRLYNH